MSKLQPNLFVGPPGSRMALTHHIDDALVLGTAEAIAKFVAELGKHIKIKMWRLLSETEPVDYVGGAHWRTNDGGVLETPLAGYVAGIGALFVLLVARQFLHLGSEDLMKRR